MTHLLFDLEANGLDPDTIHVICTKVYPNGESRTFTDPEKFVEYTKELKVSKFFAHNGLGYDVPVLNKLLGRMVIDPKDVVDTSVVSKLRDYKKYRTHSLKEIGEDLKVYKGDYTGGWDVCTKEMIDYCVQDVEVLEAIVKNQWPFIMNKANAKALRVEHDMAILSHTMQTNGFLFDKKRGEALLEEIVEEKDALEKSLRSKFKPKLIEVKRVKLRYTKDGRLFKNILDDMTNYPKVEVDSSTSEVIVFDWTDFNPASPKERIDILWEAGWKPVEKTKGHISKLKEGKDVW